MRIYAILAVVQAFRLSFHGLKDKELDPEFTTLVMRPARRAVYEKYLGRLSNEKPEYEIQQTKGERRKITADILDLMTTLHMMYFTKEDIEAMDPLVLTQVTPQVLHDIPVEVVEFFTSQHKMVLLTNNLQTKLNPLSQEAFVKVARADNIVTESDAYG